MEGNTGWTLFKPGSWTRNIDGSFMCKAALKVHSAKCGCLQPREFVFTKEDKDKNFQFWSDGQDGGKVQHRGMTYRCTWEPNHKPLFKKLYLWSAREHKGK